MLDTTVESKGNVIYVNGQKQAWFNLKDLMKFGGPESTLEERYKLLYNDRVNKVRNNSSNTNKTKKL